MFLKQYNLIKYKTVQRTIKIYKRWHLKSLGEGGVRRFFSKSTHQMWLAAGPAPASLPWKEPPHWHQQVHSRLTEAWHSFSVLKKPEWRVFHTAIKSIFFWVINKAFSRRQRRTLQLGSCWCADSDLHKIPYALRIFSIDLSTLIQTALEGAFLWNLPRITQSGKEK